MTPTTVTLALTGACAAAYTLRLFQCCLQNNIHVQFITSQPGQSVAARWTARVTGPVDFIVMRILDLLETDNNLAPCRGAVTG